MFSDGVLAAGALDTTVPITASFAFGGVQLYNWIDRNPRVRMLRTDKAYDPGLIARQPAMMSINGAPCRSNCSLRRTPRG
jgi:acyl-CoA hydrolase